MWESKRVGVIREKARGQQKQFSSHRRKKVHKTVHDWVKRFTVVATPVVPTLARGLKPPIAVKIQRATQRIIRFQHDITRTRGNRLPSREKGDRASGNN